MNLLEKQMIDILIQGKENFGYLGIKSEFEAEGSRSDEMLRIVEITRKANLKLGIKIGGCEAITDLYNTKLLGAEYIIAPMIETPYALKKYIEAKNKVYSKQEREDVRFLFNLETITAYNNFESIVNVAKIENGADGVVFGRVDFVGSMGYSREKISSQDICDYIDSAAKICRDNSLDFVVGGAISNETISPVIKTKEIYLSRFETRKIIFDADILNIPNFDIDKALEFAVKFELLWLQNKQNYYSVISKEDDARIDMLKKRFEKMIG